MNGEAGYSQSRALISTMPGFFGVVGVGLLVLQGVAEVGVFFVEAREEGREREREDERRDVVPLGEAGREGVGVEKGECREGGSRLSRPREERNFFIFAGWGGSCW